MHNRSCYLTYYILQEGSQRNCTISGCGSWTVQFDGGWKEWSIDNITIDGEARIGKVKRGIPQIKLVVEMDIGLTHKEN